MSGPQDQGPQDQGPQDREPDHRQVDPAARHEPAHHHEPAYRAQRVQRLPERWRSHWRDLRARLNLRRRRHRRRRPERPPLTAFVLAGGGSRGAVQVGMLAELVDRGIRADRVYGASVGSVNGAAYAGDPTPHGMTQLEALWRGITGSNVFPRGRIDGPWMFFQQRPAVHSNSGLRRIIAEGIAFERLEEAAVPFEVVTTSLDDGHERWITRGPAVDAVLASAAIPAIFPPVVIDGERLADGGIVNNVPISRAMAAGATRIYVLLCGPLPFRPREARRPVEAVMTALFVAIHARFVRELATVPEGVEVVVFSGGGEPSADYRDFSATNQLIDEGRAEVASVLDRLGEDRREPLPARGRGRRATAPAPPAAPAPAVPPPPAAPAPAATPAAPARVRERAAAAMRGRGPRPSAIAEAPPPDPETSGERPVHEPPGDAEPASAGLRSSRSRPPAPGPAR